MKKILILLFVLLCLISQAQVKVKINSSGIVRSTNNSKTFGAGVPKGFNVVDMTTNKQYLVVNPLDSSATITSSLAAGLKELSTNTPYGGGLQGGGSAGALNLSTWFFTLPTNTATLSDFMPWTGSGTQADNKMTITTLKSLVGGTGFPSGSGIPIVSSGTSWGTTITNNSANWDKYNQWDGGATGLTAATGRASLKVNFSVQEFTSTSVALDVNNGLNCNITVVTGNITVTITNALSGQTGNVIVKNAAAGKITFVLSGATVLISPYVYNSGASANVTGGNNIDCFSWYYDATTSKVRLLVNGTINYL